MHRLVWAALLLAACGESKDDRPLELEYLTQAILAPSCGATQCHSTFKQAGNYVFDTPEAARRTIVDEGLIRFDSSVYDPDMPNMSRLIVWVTEIDPEAAGIGRMPFDAPLPNADVELLKEWISVQAPGAQCNPDKNNRKACNNNEVVECSADWTFGPRVAICMSGCALGTCL